MKNLWFVTLLLSCLVAVPATAHDQWFQPLGWSGPHPNGGQNYTHPEDFCKNWQNYVCMIAGAHSFGNGLGKWPIDVWYSGGEIVPYLTNKNNEYTRGWIVVISDPGRWWNFRAMPGSFDGVLCSAFDPSLVSGYASQRYSPSNYYYQASQNGHFWGTPCVF